MDPISSIHRIPVESASPRFRRSIAPDTAPSRFSVSQTIRWSRRATHRGLHRGIFTQHSSCAVRRTLSLCRRETIKLSLPTSSIMRRRRASVPTPAMADSAPATATRTLTSNASTWYQLLRLSHLPSIFSRRSGSLATSSTILPRRLRAGSCRVSRVI